MFLGLRTVIYPAPDVAASRAWYTALLGIEPYFDQPFYVGYQVAGYELALDPHADASTAPITYWGVANAQSALDALLEAGATPHSDGVQDVGDNIRTATVLDPAGNIIGIIENPHFKLPADHDRGAGPGR